MQRRSKEPSSPIEPALDFNALVAAGEGSRWTIIRRMKNGDFPEPDFYVGRHPRWLASTVRRRREEMIAEHRRAKEKQQ